MNPVAVRPGPRANDSPFISGVRILGPMPCRSCGGLVELRRTWADVRLVTVGQAGNDVHSCTPLPAAHAFVLGHDRQGCAPCHRIEDERLARAMRSSVNGGRCAAQHRLGGYEIADARGGYTSGGGRWVQCALKPDHGPGHEWGTDNQVSPEEPFA